MISGNSTAILLGKDHHLSDIISSAIFVVILFFYVFSIGSYFQIDIAPLENRVNHHQPFFTYIFGKYVDELVIVCGTASWLALSLLKRLKIIIPAIYVGFTFLGEVMGSTMLDMVVLLSLPVVLLLLGYNRFTAEKILNFPTRLVLCYLGILCAILATISLIVSAAPLFSIQSNKIPVNDYAYDIFLLFGSFTPFLIFFLITGSSARLLLARPLNKILKIERNPIFFSDKISKNTVPLLLLIMVLSIAISLVPHFPSVNSDNQEVGADSGDYVLMLSQMTNSRDSSGFIHNAFVTVEGGDRPLFLIFLYGIYKIVPASPSYIADHLSVILAPALVLSVFFLAREITSNYKMSLLSAFITAVSFQTLSSIYAGFYANSFSLVIGYFSLVFLIRFLKKSGKANFIAYLSLLTSLVLSHVYTWTILTIVTSIFLILMYKQNQYERKRIIPLALVVLLSVVIDVSRTVLTTAQGGISGDVALANTGAGFPQLDLLWSNLTTTMQDYGGGQFGNFIVLGLGLYWLIRVDLREPMSLFLTIFLAIGTIPLLFGGQLIQFRVFYDIPFQIPAGIALACTGRRINWFMVLPVCIWLVAVSLRMVTNFYYVSPS
ncbi:MAG TPA: hypothetical protein VEJ68_05755 [Candidatus Bathyarchaeia archaeon]|nr:hypothetical protein [Candidatus Bathyarchaeia archaeon]